LGICKIGVPELSRRSANDGMLQDNESYKTYKIKYRTTF